MGRSGIDARLWFERLVSGIDAHPMAAIFAERVKAT